MRNILSTVTCVDVTPAYAAAVEELLPRALERPERETYSREHGHKAYQTALICYPSPYTGLPVWAVYDADGATTEMEEASSREEAEARYEEMVRARASCLGYDVSDKPETFTFSDVSGVPVEN